MELKGKRALVTGAAHRLGRVIALALAERGVQVAVHYRSSEEDARLTARECGERTPGAIALQADLTHPGETESLFDALGERWGGVHLAVSSAGAHRKTPVERLSDTDWDDLLSLNLTAAARCIRLAAAQMKRLGGGAIVSLTDALLHPPYPGFGPYVAAKAGLEALTGTWAAELGPSGVRVNAVAPGIILPADSDSAASIARWEKRIPLGRMGTPGELADAVCFLLGADYVTGQILAVDGGLGVRR